MGISTETGTTPGDLMMAIKSGKPDSYLGPLPIKLATNPADPMSERDDMYNINSVRDYFKIVRQSAKKCIEEFESLSKTAMDRFNGLSDAEQDDMFKRTLQSIKEELPVRVLKEKIGDEKYAEILKPLT